MRTQWFPESIENIPSTRVTLAQSLGNYAGRMSETSVMEEILLSRIGSDLPALVKKRFKLIVPVMS